MHDVYLKIHQVAASDTTVLIRGESGTGKELAASAIHYSSRLCAETVGESQLRRAERRIVGKRAVRPREGRLHRLRFLPARAAWKRPRAGRCSSTKSAISPRPPK